MNAPCRGQKNCSLCACRMHGPTSLLRLGPTAGERPPTPRRPTCLQAVEEYEKAARLEPSSAAYFESLTKAKVAAAKQAEEGRHKFKRKAEPAPAASGSAAAVRPVGSAAKKKSPAALSFSVGDDE